MMFSIRFFKTKYAGLIGMFFSLVMFMTGCQRKDEAIVLIPSGEDVAEFPSLEAVEQAAEPAGSSVTVQEPAKAEPQMIYVYVCGAVRDPGVVEVPEGSRAEEALRLVGGMTAEADPFYVNLAETVTDGQKLYFPTLEEAETLEARGKSDGGGTCEYQHGICGGIVCAAGDRSFPGGRYCALPGAKRSLSDEGRHYEGIRDQTERV